MIVVVVRRQPHEIGEHRVAQIHHDLVRHPAYRVVGEVRSEAAHQKNCNDQGGQPDEQPAFLVHETAVEQRLEERRESRLGQRRHHHCRDGQRERRPVRLDVAEEAKVELQASGVGRCHGCAGKC